MDLKNYFFYIFLIAILFLAFFLTPDTGKLFINSPQEFQKLTSDEQIEVLRDITAKYGVIKSATFLARACLKQNKKEAMATLLCEYTPLAREIGFQLYNKYGKDGNFYCSKIVQGAPCYRAIIQKALLAEGLSVVSPIIDTCRSHQRIFSEQWPYLFEACAHGFGHAFGAFRSYDISSGLKDCKRFFESEGLIQCRSGVFHNYFLVNDEGDDVGARMNADEPLYPCSSLETKYQAMCFYSLPDGWYYGLEYSVKKNSQLCEEVNDSKLRTSCLLGIGTAIGRNDLDFGNIQEICHTAGSWENKSFCIISAIGEMKYQRYNSWARSSSEICEQIEDSLNATIRNKCQQLIDYIKFKRMFGLKRWDNIFEN